LIKGVFADLIQNISLYDGVVVGIGNCKIRTKLHAQLVDAGAKLVPVIHPRAIIGVDCCIGSGSVILANAVINYGATLSAAVIINTAAIVDHDCVIGEGAHICPGVNLAGQVSVGNCSWVGIGSSVKELIRIGCDVTIGAGAAVISDIPDGKTAIGVPAKIL
jgi:sugar O-acyltransferase (sialic acid O-acetyltransferase NeuD family)